MEHPHSTICSSSNHTPLSSSSSSSVSPSSPSLSISSVEERNAESLQEEYETIDKLLQRTQEDLTTLSTEVPPETPTSPSLVSTPSSSCDQFVSLSSADRNHYLDFLTLSETSHSYQEGSESPLKPQKPERPGTLSRPVLLPSCCKFKAKPWHSLVTGDYSYSKINSGETETETNSSDYKRDLDDIMRELELYLERDKNGNIGNSEDADQVKTRGLSSPMALKSSQFLPEHSRNTSAKNDANIFLVTFSNSHEDLDVTNNNPLHFTRTTFNNKNSSTNEEITIFSKNYNHCERTPVNPDSSIYSIPHKPKRRSRTLSPSRLDITQKALAFDSRRCEYSEKKPQAFSNMDDLSLRKIKKRSHYAGLKTNGCLKNRDPVSIHNKANEILLQKFMSKTNPSNECWSFSPFDYKIKSLSGHRCCMNFPNQATSQIQKQISNQASIPLSNHISRQSPKQPSHPIIPIRPPNQIINQSSKEIPNHFPHRISNEIAFPTTRRTSNPFLGKKLRALSKENLLDKLHRTFYPGLYRSGSNSNNSSSCFNNDKRISTRRSSLDDSINDGFPKILLCSKSFASKDQDLVNGRTRSTLDKSSLKSSSKAKNPDSSRSLPVTPAKEQPTYTDQKLMQTCWWLILSGFPQYVQMYKDDRMPITEEQLLEDHHFLEREEMEFLKKRILLLNQLYMKKIQPPPPAYSKMASFQEFQHCLSWKWTYDRLSCSWIRTNQAEPHNMSRTSTKESLSSTSSPTTSSSSSSSTVSADKPRPKDWTIQREQVPCIDSSSLHMTSGYESEVSPVSTSIFYKGAEDHNRKTTPTRTLTTSTTTTTTTMTMIADVNHNYELSPRVVVEKSCNDSLFLSSASLKHSSNFKRISRDSQKEFHSHDDIVSTSSQRHHHNHHHHQNTSSPEVSPPHCLFPGTRRRSGFYDNELLDTSAVDGATLELDLILSEFYRDIGEEATNEVQVDVTKEPVVTSLVNQEELVHQKDSQVFIEPNQPREESNPEPEPESRNLNTITRSTSTDERFGRLIGTERLTASQFAVLKKLATLKISGIFDRFDLPSDFLCSTEKIKDTPIQSQDKLFGVHPSVYLRRTGKSLPPAIASLMSFIEDSSTDSVGIFRKPGVQSRILSLQKHIDQFADEKFDTSLDVDPYDAADVFKRYLRDLPETLLTESLCSSFSLIFSSLPSLCVTECLQYLMILLPDINRSILYEVVHFLHRISQQSTLNQMTPANMAVCFLPSLFRMNDSQSSTGTASNSNVLSPAPLNWDHKSALMCLTQIIEKPQETFCIPRNLLEIANKILDHLSTFTFVDTYLRIHSFQQTQTPDYIAGFLFSSMKHFKMYRGWSQLKLKSFPEASISVSSERNGSFLPSWKCQLEILAPPVEIINKIHKDSQPWVGHMLTQNVLERKVVEKNKIHNEVVAYEFLLPSDISSGGSVEDEGFLASSKRSTSELRAWKTDLPKESCFYCSKSVLDDKRRTSDDETREVHIVESSFFLEPCGEGLTSLTHISTVDLIGHSVDWYEAAFPPIILRYFTDLQLYFRQKIANASGPETKV